MSNNNDVLEQKAREFRKKNGIADFSHTTEIGIDSQHPHGTDYISADELAAAFAREIVQQAAMSVCFNCRDGGDAFLRRDEVHGWRHVEQGRYDVRCLAGPIWEAFGRKEETRV